MWDYRNIYFLNQIWLHELFLMKKTKNGDDSL